MASDLSSGCTDDINIFEEKEEGEISLEDVSSSEECHTNYRADFRTAGRCATCTALQMCAPWCAAARAAQKSHRKQDPAQGKENRLRAKDSSGATSKHATTTLQEKNEDFLLISSDSDMEYANMPGNSKQLYERSKSVKFRKRKKKKRSHNSATRIEDALSPNQVESYVVDVPVVKKLRSSRSRHRESSPPSRYSSNSPLDSPVLRSPSRRYRATRTLKSRLPLRRSRSPSIRDKFVVRKSPRKLRSLRRSPAPRSPVRSSLYRGAREHVSSSSQTHVDIYATKLLKKVRLLESVGSDSTKDLSKSKEHSSLKEKLSNMMKKQTEGSHEKPNSQKRNNINIENNNSDNNNVAVTSVETDDEDNVELLRRLALETKQKKSENKIEETKVINESANAMDSDDNDIEANELRILALRSAIMKKHEKRVMRGVKSKKLTKSETRVESPFNESFLDDIHDSREESSVKSPMTRSSPTLDDESIHTDDMDLDTDVEREKEKDYMPYSPTDDLTRDTVVEAELPESNDNNNEDEKLALTQKENYTKNEQHASPEGSDYMAGVDIPYSPSAPMEIQNFEKFASQRLVNEESAKTPSEDKENSSLVEKSDYTVGVHTPYSPSAPMDNQNFEKFVSQSLVNEEREKIATENIENPSSPERSDCASEKSMSYYLHGADTSYLSSGMVETPEANKFSSDAKNNTNTESPYSPTDTPILDSELFPIFPNLSVVPENIECIEGKEDEETSKSKMEQVNSAVVENFAWSIQNESMNEAAEVSKNSEINLQYKENKTCESSLTSLGVTALPFQKETSKAIDTIDKLPEVDLDGSPLVPMSKELETVELAIPIEIIPSTVDTINEPFYLQCLSDVTKDTNKIPTLLNRTLVPVPILKTNKQLQQPLPHKKVDNHEEPSFKSAEMRPVNVVTTSVKPATLFKPIKLCPIPKKPQVMTMAAAAFNTSFGDDFLKETKSEDESVIVEAKTTRTVSPVPGNSRIAEEQTEQKKKGVERNKKRSERYKRKNSVTAETSNCEIEFNKNRTKNGESNSSYFSDKKVKTDVDSGSNVNERVTRASSKSSLAKSLENCKKAVQKGSIVKNTDEREASNARNNKGTTSKKVTIDIETRKKKTPRKKRRSSKKLNRSSSNITAVGNKSSDLEVTKSIDERANTFGEKEETETKKNDGEPRKAIEESKNFEEGERKRRCSVDEDEEALRALLLASLPKRPNRPIESSLSTPPTNPVAKISQISDATTDTSVNNSRTKIVNESSACFTDSVFSSVNPSIISSQSSNVCSVKRVKIEGLGGTTKNTEVGREIVANESNISGVQTSTLPLRKRTNSIIVKGPPKKILKKTSPVIASTKVVNNAKRYQNALLQKKLNLRRVATNYGSQNGSRNITLNNLKNNDCARPSSPKISIASKMQRLVINLGSDTDSESEPESQSLSFINSDTQTQIRTPLPIPTTDFEKSVEQFLKDQRKKLESVKVSKSPTNLTQTANKNLGNSTSLTTGKLSGLYNTPLAVRRHLPMSQQEEYRRLKQQIMERERQKLQKTMENGSLSQNSNLKSPCTPPGPLSPASPIAATQKSQINQKVWSVTPQSITNTLAPLKNSKSLENPTVVQQKNVLPKVNEKRTITNATKDSKTIVSKILNKELRESPAVSSNVNSSITNIPFDASTKILPKANSVIPAKTSTAKTQSSISSKTCSNISSKASLPLLKSVAASTTDNSGKLSADTPSISTTIPVDSSESVATRNKGRSSFNTNSVSPLPLTKPNSVNRSSLNPMEMLTIQIPNDKAIPERVASTGISKGESSSPPNGRDVGMLRILTKEQLNNRFVKIQVKQGATGRTVTLGESSLTQDDAARSVSSPPVSKVLSEDRSDKSDKSMCCDNSLIVNESTATRRDEIISRESVIEDSDASTLVLSRSEENTRNEKTIDSTNALTHSNIQKDTSVVSVASTFVLNNDHSGYRENSATARTEESEDGGSTSKSTGTKRNKVQAKEAWEKIRTDVKNELEIFTALPTDRQRIILIESQENLVAKRNMVLEDLTEMSGCLRQWEVEREIQTKLIAEVQRLREQLRTAENRLYEQRRQMNGISPKVTKAHAKINHGRRECYKLSRICHGLGTKIMGEDYKVPDNGAQLLNERLKEVAIRTRQLSKKKVSSVVSLNDSRDVNSLASSNSSDVSESSFAKRQSNATTLLSETMNIVENLLTSKTDCNYIKVTIEHTEPSSISIVHSPCLNPNSERVDFLTEEEEDESSEAHATSNETRVSSSATKVSQMEDREVSNAFETNAQAMEKEESKPFEMNNQTKETVNEASSSSECNINNNSSIPATNFINESRVEDISLPRTSKPDVNDELMSSDGKLLVKSKIEPYKSVLTHLKASRSVKTDGILCPYELMGTCSDGDCQFYHLDPGHCQ